MAERAGLSAHVIRVWERRYGAVAPRRLANGYRQYSDADIDRLRALRELTEAGHGIGDVAQLAADELAGLLDRQRALSGRTTDSRQDQVAGDLTLPVARAELDRAVEAWDSPRLEAVLREAAVRLPIDVFLETVLLDFLRRVGHQWDAATLSPAHEHMVSAAVPSVLEWLGRRLEEPPEDAPLAVFATLSGTRHDVGARIAALVARSEGWRTLYLGADLPAADIVFAAAENSAALVGVSIVFPEGDPGVRDELVTLGGALDDSVDLLVGGRAAGHYAADLDGSHIVVSGGVAEMRRHLGLAR